MQSKERESGWVEGSKLRERELKQMETKYARNLRKSRSGESVHFYMVKLELESYSTYLGMT